MEARIFEVTGDGEGDWPNDEPEGIYETVCLRCDHWAGRPPFLVQAGWPGVMRELVEYHVRSNEGHSVRVTYRPCGVRRSLIRGRSEISQPEPT